MERRAELYPTAFVESLAAQFKINPERVVELKRLLEGWADVFRRYKFDVDDRRHLTSTVRSELRRIKQRVDALRSALDNLHPETDWRLWAPEGEHAVELMPTSRTQSAPYPKDEVELGPYGHTLTRVWTCDGHSFLMRIEQSDHYESLTILRNYAATAIARLPSDKGGRFRREALRMWLVNVRSYWTDVLGRRFSYKKESARFCIEAFKLIDPSFPESRLIMAIRNVLYPPKKPK